MTSLADLRPGDLMFARHVRPLAADLLILMGQTILGQPGYPHHVGVVTQASGTDRPYRDGPMVVEAMPNGAREVEIGAERWTEDYIYVRPAYEPEPWRQGFKVAVEARKYIGTPYSFADYLALAVHKASGEGYAPIEKRNALQRYVSSSGRMICSQLADQAMSDAGFHVFDDGRLPQDVTPGALYEKLLDLPGTTTLHPRR